MGKYDIYIWPSYIAAALALVSMAYFSWKSKKSDEDILKKLEELNREDR